MKKISIIGGSGFLGTNLCELFLESGQEFEIIDIKPSKRFNDYFKFGDVRDIQSLEKSITGEIIINLAAVHRDDVANAEDYFTTNVEGAKNVCLAATNKSINLIIFTSSVAVYGLTKEPTGEDGSINPFNDYGLSKFQAEEAYEAWNDSDKSNRLTIIRPTVIFGPGNRGNVYNLLNQINSRYFAMIGDGKNIKSLAYVKNVAAFLQYSLNYSAKLSIYNYVDKPDIKLMNFVLLARNQLKIESRLPKIPYFLGIFAGYIFDILSIILNRKLAITSFRIKKFTSSTHFLTSIDFNKFKPPFELEDALSQTIRDEFIDRNGPSEVFYTE